MQNKNCFTGRLDVKAFTLIELLVVVLIIGILVAVALPKYQRAVDKSRAMDIIVQGKPLLQAQQRCYLATGRWCKLDEVDIEVPKWGQSDSAFRRSSTHYFIEISTWFGYSTPSLWCVAGNTNERGKQICQTIGTEHHTLDSGSVYYLVDKQGTL